MSEGRFSLEWDRPFLEGALTHVSLFEGGKDPLHVVASGHGPSDADALLDLWAALKERNEPIEAIAFVSEEYRGLTGKQPTRRSS